MYAKTMNTRKDPKGGPRASLRPQAQPQWQERVVFTTRILPATRARLDAPPARRLKKGPQAIAEEALNDYFDRMGIPAADQLNQGEQS